MQINRISAVNYRNLSNIEIFPDSRMNVICGENAQGKTNIIEAIWMFTGAKSFRATSDSSFIKFGTNKASCEIDFISKGTENNAKIEYGEKKTAFLNNKTLSNPSKLAGNFNAIVFSPSDLQIITDGPEKRRRFVDLGIGQIFPQYIDILRDYTRAVKQRNEIIKEYKYDSSIEILLDSFEEKIVESGTKIIMYRERYISKLQNYMPEIFEGLTNGKEEIMSVNVANVSATMFKELLKRARKEDSFTGTTSIGPHRDDFEFRINGVNSRSYGSQGQKRSVALCLKLAQSEVIKEKTGEYPVCLLDDVMSELDAGRQNYILNHIKDWQSFITCCDPATVERAKVGKIFNIENGRCL